MDNKKLAKIMRDTGHALVGLSELLDPPGEPVRRSVAQKPERQGATVAPGGLSGRDFQKMLQASGMTQAQLAAKLGVSSTTVKLWIAKRANPLPKARVDAVRAALVQPTA